MLFVVTVAITGLSGIFHTIWGTSQSWPAALLASNTAFLPKLTLYAMWLFSCVIFLSVPAALLWSLRAPAAAGRFVVRYAAVPVVALMAAWASAMALGLGSNLPPTGPISLGLLAALTALSAPSRPRLAEVTPVAG